jgi:putative ABC transport system permease protein
VPSAIAGTLLSSWAVRLFASQVPDDFLGRGGHFVFDARIAFFVVVVCGLTTMLLSLAPLFFARRVDLNLMLGQGGRTAGRTPSQVRARNGMLVAQLTLTLMLMVAAGLFVSSFAWLMHVPLGFEPDGRLALVVRLSGANYAGDAPKRAFAARLLDAARATPGVTDASIDSSSPLLSGPLLSVVAANRPRPEPGSETRTILRAVAPDYFRALGLRQLEGRPFSTGDVDGAPRVAIINEYLAAQLFPGERAVGQRLELLPTARQSWTDRPGVVDIVGVVANARDVSVEEVQFSDVYLPYAQAPSPTVELIVRSAIAPDGLVTPLRNAAAALDPSLPVARIETLDARVNDSLKGARFNLILIASFAIVAIVLACVGIYGTMACAVQERAREFGIRLALGQPPAGILRATVWQSARFGIVASLLGLGASLIIARLIGNALYLVRGEHPGLIHGVTTTDPLTLASAAAALIVVATLSGVIPARQATSVDPLVVLRTE